MASIISADSGLVSGVPGLKTSADSSGALQIQTGNNVTAITVDASQNVGIGTTSPNTGFGLSYVLYNSQNTGTVASNAYNLIQSVNRNAVVELTGVSTALNFVNFSSTPGSAVVGVGADIANQALLIRTGGLTERLRMDSSGRLLIGTSSASGSNLFQLNSDALIYGLTVGRGGGAISGNTTLGASALAGGSQTGTSLTALGFGTLNVNSSGNYNTAVGASALQNNSTASDNTATGYQALFNNSTGADNTASGFQSLVLNTTGANNTAFGSAALKSNTTASNNTAVGYQAGYTNSTGTYNTFLGMQAGYTSNAAAGTGYNTCVGYFAGYALTTGAGNTFVGSFQSGGTAGAGSAVTTGSKNVIIGAYTGAAAPISATGSNYIVLSDGDGQVRQTINSSGYVGIGNTSPAALLHVGSLNGTGSLNGYTKLAIEATDYAVLTLKAPTANANQILFTDTTTTYLGGINYYNSTNATPNAMAFLTNSTERMRIDSSGNLGIGTSSPSAVLGVNGDIKFGSNSSGTYPGGRFYTNSGTVFIEQLNTQSMQFKTNSAEFIWNQGANERMRIDTSGNVGIGITSPGYKLDVGTGSVSGNIHTYGSITSGTLAGYSIRSIPRLTNDTGTLENTYIGCGASVGNIIFQQGSSFTAASNTERMRIDSSGIVLVGGTAARTTQAKLELTSAANTALSLYMYKTSQVEVTMGFKSSTDSNFYVGTGSPTIGTYGVYLTNTGSSWNAVSDERMKTILEPIENASAKVATLRAVMGYYNNDTTQTRRPFLIAQDVQAVLPEAVNIQDVETGTLGMSYTDTIPLLVAAIKEQQALITSLTDRIEALESK